MTMQAKRAGQAFLNTTLVNVLDRPLEFYPERTCIFEGLIDDFMERRCVEIADLVLSSSDGATARARLGWNFSASPSSN